jgi:hypothetical protein
LEDGLLVGTWGLGEVCWFLVLLMSELNITHYPLPTFFSRVITDRKLNIFLLEATKLSVAIFWVFLRELIRNSPIFLV